jgi:membrane-bound lytic murein transglycosylase B
VRCAGLSVVAILLSALAPQRVLSQVAASGQVEPAGFAKCIAELEHHARSSGISNATTDHLTGLSSDPDVLGAVQSQAEFERPIWEYVDANVSEARISTGRGKLAEWAGPLDAIEARFGVDRHILVAIWGIESTFGAVLDDPGIVRSVVRSLATLTCGDQSRSAYWRDELMAALQMLERADVAPARMTGSWAGAMGHTQFMPTTYQKHAVDFDGDGKRDLWGASDALASTANYLSSLGWRKGQRWGFEVQLPPGFDYSLADETTERPLSVWVELGLRVIGDHAAATEQGAVLVLPAGAHGPAFLLLPNFRTILGYNTAMSYALSVAHLSDRLRGAPPFAHDWPRQERMLSSSERRELQSLLAKRGLEVGPVDGKVGPRTRAAIRAYQRSVGLAPDGYANSTLLETVRADP